jgi:bifunctional enzyme CysN/CysC
VELFGQELDEATPPMSVVLRLTDELDVSRGDMICRPHNAPTVGQDVDAMVCWFSERPLTERTTFVVKHTTRTARCVVRSVAYRLDVNSLHRDEHSGRLAMNDIGRVTLRTSQPLLYDTYRRNRTTGSFILVDEATNDTVGAGMILGEPGPVLG